MKSYNLTQFRKDLSELSIELDKNQEEQFMQYYELLIQWNEVMNLTAITDFDEVVKLDVAYLDGWTIWRDIKILLKTIKVVVMKDGAK